MVTASHNPKADDGYKLYWSNGCQITPPHDSLIASAIVEPLNLKPWKVYDIAGTMEDEAETSKITEDYFRMIKEGEAFTRSEAIIYVS